MRIGIIGHEAAKFTALTEPKARRIIRSLLQDADAVLVSGGCHLGGIDIYAEEEALALGRKTRIHTPAHRRWAPHGYKQRNIDIATSSDVVHVLVVKEYPPEYASMHFDMCYHCGKRTHIKSGGCWTGKYAQELGKTVTWWEL